MSFSHKLFWRNFPLKFIFINYRSQFLCTRGGGLRTRGLFFSETRSNCGGNCTKYKTTVTDFGKILVRFPWGHFVLKNTLLRGCFFKFVELLTLRFSFRTSCIRLYRYRSCFFFFVSCAFETWLSFCSSSILISYVSWVSIFSNLLYY